MNDIDKKTQEKIDKLLALFKRGMGGEKENAKTALHKLLARYDMTLEDLLSDQSQKVTCEVKYKSNEEKQLFVSIVDMVVGREQDSFSYRHKKIAFTDNITPAQKAEILIHYDAYRRALRAEKEKLFQAFLLRHRIWDRTPRPDEARDPLSKEEREELMRMQQMADGMEHVSILKQITN